MLKINKELKKHLQKRVNYLNNMLDVSNIEGMNNILNELETIKELAEENNIILEVI